MINLQWFGLGVTGAIAACLLHQVLRLALGSFPLPYILSLFLLVVGVAGMAYRSHSPVWLRCGLMGLGIAGLLAWH